MPAWATLGLFQTTGAWQITSKDEEKSSTKTFGNKPATKIKTGKDSESGAESEATFFAIDSSWFFIISSPALLSHSLTPTLSTKSQSANFPPKPTPTHAHFSAPFHYMAKFVPMSSLQSNFCIPI